MEEILKQSKTLRDSSHTSSNFRTMMSTGIGQVQLCTSQVGHLKTSIEKQIAQSHPPG